MSNSLALRRAPGAEAIQEAAVGQVVPLLRASVDSASPRADRLQNSVAGRIVTEVLYRDADAGTLDGTAHLAAGVVLVLSWLVRALTARTEGRGPRDLACRLAAQCRSGTGGEHVADVLDQLLDGTAGARVLGKLLVDDQEALLEAVLRLAEVAASQACVLAGADGTDLEAVWAQIEQGLRDHP